MGNRTTPPRSFNTVKQSNREVRKKRHRQERMTLLSIFTVVILILLLLLIFLVCSIADAIKGRLPADNETNQPPQTDVTTPGDIVYAQITKQNSAIYTGDLILVNADHATTATTTQVWTAAVWCAILLKKQWHTPMSMS